MEMRGTTILAVKDDKGTAMIGDGQVTMGQAVVMKHSAVKVRTLYNDQVIAGFAGATADAFTLLNALKRNSKPTPATLYAPPLRWLQTGALINSYASWKP